MALVTDLGFTMADLFKAVLDGDVRYQVHPEYPDLAIFNYTEEVQYKSRWNKISLACRGLILNTMTDEIIARPWEKFFNFGQRDLEIDFYAPVEVTDKLDGSLGILYREPGKYQNWCIATRGSFASEQAEHATEVLATKYADFIKNPLMEYAKFNTILFEIVYPENRIVVNYGDMDDLVLLGSVNNEYGWYLGPDATAGSIGWTGPVAETFEYKTFADAISAPDRKGMEGYVIRSGSKIVKLKQADYIELHRIVTNLSPKTIWQMLADGKTVDDICNDIPDEFHGYVKDIGYDLIDKASDIAVKVALAHNDAYHSSLVDGVVIRKRYAKVAQQYEYPGLMFRMLDDKDVKESVWKMVKPRGDKPLVDRTDVN